MFRLIRRTEYFLTALAQKMANNKDKISNVFLSLRTTLASAVSHIVPPKEIEDIVQETYVRVCQVEKQDEIQYPRSFMLKTARNLALDHVKRSETRLSNSLDDDLEAEFTNTYGCHDDTYNRVAANQEFAMFCEVVRELPLQCRRAFVLKKVYGYSQKEIAENLKISESTVEKHIANGIRRCTVLMKARTVVKEKTTESVRGGKPS